VLSSELFPKMSISNLLMDNCYEDECLHKYIHRSYFKCGLTKTAKELNIKRSDVISVLDIKVVVYNSYYFRTHESAYITVIQMI